MISYTTAFWNSKGQAATPKNLFYAVTDPEKDQQSSQHIMYCLMLYTVTS